MSRLSAKGVGRSALLLISWAYCLVGGCFAVYFNWQYARMHGFGHWVMFGEIIATAKAAIWPYYAFPIASGSRFGMARTPYTTAYVPEEKEQKDDPFKSWSADDLANSRHFVLSIQSDLKSLEISRGLAPGQRSASDLAEVLALKKTALREAELVQPSVVAKIHPRMPDHFDSEYKRGLTLRIRGLESPGGDDAAEAEGLRLMDAWADWFNSARENIVVPK